MCGIMGYIGERQAVPVLLQGLRALEYRGYDSAGLAVIDGDQLPVRRSVGKLDQLAAVLEREPVSGHVGLGHTRWATHGRVTSGNAHPQSDCNHELVVIHNGIVENFLALKDELSHLGHRFVSETDTEVIAHLVEEHLQHDSLTGAARRAFARLEGHNAILLISRRHPKQIIAARLGNAGGIVLGHGDGEMVLASDRLPILEYTRALSFIGSREMAVVDRHGATVYRLDGSVVKREPEIVSWDPRLASKREFGHYMLKEIHEQPEALIATCRERVDVGAGTVRLPELNLTRREIQSFSRVLITGCGTAWHAGLAGKFMLETLAGLPVEVDYASELRYRAPLLSRDALVIAVTQSGETADTLAALEQADEHGLRTVAICNTPGSRATQIAGSSLLSRCGPEIGVASTKCFTGQLACFYLLGLYLGQQRGALERQQARLRLEALEELPALMTRVLATADSCQALSAQLATKRDALFLGRNVNYPIALEGALKLKEVSYIHAEGYPAGEMKHGPIALVDPSTPVVAIATHDPVYSKMISQVEQVKARDGMVIAVANEGDEALAARADHLLYVPSTRPLLQPLLNVMPLQLLAYYVALRRGCDVDQPRNLAKSVTVE